MGFDPWPLLRPLVFTRDAENAHGMAIKALKASAIPPRRVRPDPRLSVSAAGLLFTNPLGMAAGFDKNAEVPDALIRQGFGFAEVGTLTPLAQAGNPRPRVFRLVEDEALINRLGFNNDGHDAALARLEARRGPDGVLGVNVGANKDSDDRIRDYALGVKRFAGLADYITINISSPNTPGLRDLQGEEALDTLLSEALAARGEALEGSDKTCPLFVKLAPDLDEDELTASLNVIKARQMDGVIVSNTTLARDGLRSSHKDEAGGVSGKPLFERSTRMLAQVRRILGPEITLIGVGGVDSAEAAWIKIAAGADLVQLYTGYVYQGPGLVASILKGLSAKLDATGHNSIADTVGSDLDSWL